MKKIRLCVSVVMLALLFLLVACTPDADTPAPPANDGATAADPTPAPDTDDGVAAEGEPIRVAMVLSGYLGDLSFNDSAHVGILRAQQELGIEFTILESGNPADWETNFVAVASADYDLVLAVSTQFQDIVETHAPNFPDMNIAMIDGVAGGNNPNVVSAIFAQNEGSFLAGAAAALWTTRTEIPGVNEENIIGWVGGMDIPVLSDFFMGFEQGARYIDPDIQVLQSFAGSFTDPLTGKELTLAQFDLGADIVMNVASGTGVGILEAAVEAGRFAIGVDSDQDHEAPGNVLTSMLKRVDVATFLIIESVVNNTFVGDYVLYLDISNGGVSLTDMSVMREHLGDLFPMDILEEIQALEARVLSGEIVVQNYPGFGRP